MWQLDSCKALLRTSLGDLQEGEVLQEDPKEHWNLFPFHYRQEARILRLGGEDPKLAIQGCL